MTGTRNINQRLGFQLTRRAMFQHEIPNGHYLKGLVYLREVELRTQAITAMDRYSTRV